MLAAILYRGISAQEILWQRLGEKETMYISLFSAFVDDLDRDGCEEMLQWADHYIFPEGRREEILTLSGRTGATLRVHRTKELCFYGALAATGDVNGDGVRDYAATLRAAAGSLNQVEVRSGRDESVLWSVTGRFIDLFGAQLAGDLDLNGDGRPDLLVGAPWEGTGAIYAHDHSGRRLYRLAPPDGALELAALGGDLDGDRCDDFLVGHGEPGLRGAVTACSGRTGHPLVNGYGELPGDGMGLGDVVGCGDVDGDGVLDFAGASGGGFGQPNLLRVFSGVSGQPIYSIRRPNGVDFGRVLLSADLDQDGVHDLLAYSGEMTPDRTRGGSVWWYSLRDGTLVTTIYPPPSVSGFPYFASIGSLGRPHRGDIFPVFTSPDCYDSSGNRPQGRATLFRAAPPGVVARGATCKGSLPQAPRIGLRDLGPRGFRVHLSRTPPAATAMLLLGSSRTRFRTLAIEIDLDGLGFSGCSLQVPIELAVPVVTGTSGIDAGYAFVDVPCPLNQGAGVSLHAQWLVLGTGAQAPGALSDALTTRH
jgi:hypothetical protein